MKKFIGMTSHIWYFSKFTDICITLKDPLVKIYIISDKIKDNEDCIDISKLEQVWTKEINKVETFYLLY